MLPIFWLMYKLEQEAWEAGGVMTFMLGNHEEMVLRGNLKYTRSKYKDWQHLLEWSMPICGMRRASWGVGCVLAI